MRISCVLRRCQNCASAVLLLDTGTLSLEDSFSHLLIHFYLTDSHLSIKEVSVFLWINNLDVYIVAFITEKHSAPSARWKTAGRYLVHCPGRRALGWRKHTHTKNPYSLLTRGTLGPLAWPWDWLLLAPLKKMHKMHLMRYSLFGRLKEEKGSRGFEDQIIPP